MSDVNQQGQNCEPVAWTDENFMRLYVSKDIADIEGANVELYAAPPKREPLSEDEIKQIEFTVRTYKREPLDVVAFASAIELAHGIGGQS